MIELIDELRTIIEDLRAATRFTNDLAFGSTLNSLLKNIKKVEHAWFGSWFGYRANVYYIDFDSPPLEKYVGNNWGDESDPSFELRNDAVWCNYSDTQVDRAIEDGIARSDISNAFDHTRQWIDKFEERKEDILAIISIAQTSHSSLFDRLANRTAQLHIPSIDEIIESKRPDKLQAQNPLVQQQGIRIPPHIRYYARVIRSIRAAKNVYELSKVVENTIAQIQRVRTTEASPQINGNKVFIGHGRSRLWLELKEFLKDTLNYEIAEFNEEPAAGIHTVANLERLLNESRFAFLIMTGEIDIEGKRFPRPNVIHEAGLFQARLGFDRAIILLEEGCEIFSNINGLTWIPFHRDNISSAFEDIREILAKRGNSQASN